MRRALVLILTLCLLTFGCGWWLDHLQQRTAETYLDRLSHIRQLIVEGDLETAASEQAAFHVQWQHDAHWLNYLLDHHHTRDVESSIRHLSTALLAQDRIHALLATDELTDALEEVSQRDVAIWENIM